MQYFLSHTPQLQEKDLSFLNELEDYLKNNFEKDDYGLQLRINLARERELLQIPLKEGEYLVEADFDAEGLTPISGVIKTKLEIYEPHRSKRKSSNSFLEATDKIQDSCSAVKVCELEAALTDVRILEEQLSDDTFIVHENKNYVFNSALTHLLTSGAYTFQKDNKLINPSKYLFRQYKEKVRGLFSLMRLLTGRLKTHYQLKPTMLKIEVYLKANNELKQIKSFQKWIPQQKVDKRLVDFLLYDELDNEFGAQQEIINFSFKPQKPLITTIRQLSEIHKKIKKGMTLTEIMNPTVEINAEDSDSNQKSCATLHPLSDELEVKQMLINHVDALKNQYITALEEHKNDDLLQILKENIREAETRLNNYTEKKLRHV